MASPSLSHRDLSAALLVVLIWGSSFLGMKFALEDFTPMQVGVGRYLFAALPLVLVLRPPPVRWRWMALYGLLQGVGQFGFLFLALKLGMTAALASVLMQTQVFFTALLGFLLLHERPGRPLQLGLLLAAVGLLCFALNYLGGHSAGTTLTGFGLTLAGAFMWGASNIVARHTQQVSPDFDPLAFVAWSSLAPVLPFVLLSALFDPQAAYWLQGSSWQSVSLRSWLSLAFIGWVATSLAYALWTGLLRRHPANRVAPFSLGVPVVGMSGGMLVLGESVTPWQWTGSALVLAALVCVVWGPALWRRLGR